MEILSDTLFFKRVRLPPHLDIQVDRWEGETELSVDSDLWFLDLDIINGVKEEDGKNSPQLASRFSEIEKKAPEFIDSGGTIVCIPSKESKAEDDDQVCSSYDWMKSIHGDLYPMQRMKSKKEIVGGPESVFKYLKNVDKIEYHLEVPEPLWSSSDVFVRLSSDNEIVACTCYPGVLPGFNDDSGSVVFLPPARREYRKFDKRISEFVENIFWIGDDFSSGISSQKYNSSMSASKPNSGRRDELEPLLATSLHASLSGSSLERK